MPLACFDANTNVLTHWKHTIRRTVPLMAQHCQVTPIRNEPGKGFYVSTFILGNDIHVVPVNYFIRIDQRRKTALHSEVRSFCKM